ncbi:MAG: T9SS C-terminal target domain-containing protein [Calditrichaeota bacterium]|nr:MAG: T9SS C-terminal target domain-containing protein [Calditrichota bacterium]MBL1206780.1 T9SS C-terminal target domain-containing protein [Calditrichota bacterium]NOG46608.1 T9SS type A sorting domain-containing protein [Calditrichota bacterium]
MKTLRVLLSISIFAIILSAGHNEDNKKSKLSKVTVTGETARMDINNIDLALTNDGQTGNDADSFYPKGTDLSFLFSGGVCFSGYVEGDLRTAWMAPASRIQEMQPGNLGSDPDALEYVFYTVNSSDSFGSDNYNKWADAVAIGADFFDADGDGEYDPNIDTPDILGDRTLWCVYNDSVPATSRDMLNTGALGLEVRQSIWAFEKSDALGDVVFIRYRVVNASENDIDDLIISGWTDPDIGNATDDLIGCDTTLNLGYIYNFQDDNEYGANPPAFGIDFIQGPIVDSPGDTAFHINGLLMGTDTILNHKNLGMTSFMYMTSWGGVITYPATKEIARYYQEGGLDAEGEPIIASDWGIGGDSHSDVRYFFSGDPVTQTGWLDNTPQDIRFLINSGPFQLKAGERQDIIIAYIVTQGSSALNSVTKLKATSLFLNDLFPFKDPVTGLNDEFEDKKIPISFQLEQNRPNPFNPQTVIRYELPVNSKINITVYGALGRKVKTLINRRQTAGSHQVVFNGANMASGVYYYRLQAENFVDTYKMLLIK